MSGQTPSRSPPPTNTPRPQQQCASFKQKTLEGGLFSLTGQAIKSIRLIRSRASLVLKVPIPEHHKITLSRIHPTDDLHLRKKPASSTNAHATLGKTVLQTLNPPSRTDTKKPPFGGFLKIREDDELIPNRKVLPGIELFSQGATPQLLSPLLRFTPEFEMDRGGTTTPWTPG